MGGNNFRADPTVSPYRFFLAVFFFAALGFLAVFLAAGLAVFFAVFLAVVLAAFFAFGLAAIFAFLAAAGFEGLAAFLRAGAGLRSGGAWTGAWYSLTLGSGALGSYCGTLSWPLLESPSDS